MDSAVDLHDGEDDWQVDGDDIRLVKDDDVEKA
jgi:hypothetical protein